MRLMRDPSEKSHIGPREVRPLEVAMDQQEAFTKAYRQLEKIGIALDSRDLRQISDWMNAQRQYEQHGMDAALTAPLTTASVPGIIQNLQHWLPGLVQIITAARKIDTLIGVTTQGNWYDEEIVQQVLERVGNARPYTDSGNVPHSSWNTNYERRTIVRFEEGMEVGRLEEARSAAIRVNSASEKRGAAADSLEIERNRIGFFGYNNGANRTYGLLNDTDLPAYVTLATGAGGDTEWSTKTYLEIIADLLTSFTALRVQSQDKIDPKTDKLTLGISITAVDSLSRVNDLGKSVYQWMKENYPNVRVVSVPEFNAANGGESVYYLYADSVADSGSDDRRTFIQVVPTKFRTNGVDQKAKSYEESYGNATAGVMTKRPYAIVRYTGV